MEHDREYGKLNERQQALFQRLYLSPHVDIAGFVALELDWWSTRCTPPIPMDELRGLLDSLAPTWVVTDYAAHQALVVPRMRLDEIEKQPFVYVGACKCIVASRSDLLAEHAYVELDRLPSPRTEKLGVQESINKAYDGLLVAMEKRRRRYLDAAVEETLSTPSQDPLKTLSETEVEAVDGRDPLDTLSTPMGEGEGLGRGKGATPRRAPTQRGSRRAIDPSKCSDCGKRSPGGGPHYPDLCDVCMRARHSAAS